MLRVGRGFGKLAWKGMKSEVCIIRGLLGGPKSQRFGIGLAAAFAPEVKGVGWAVAAAFTFADAAAGPCWSRGGLVSRFKSAKNPRFGLGAGCRLRFW